MPFEFKKMEIEDVILITPKVFKDERGFFLESYKKSDFVLAGIKDDFTQDNHSKSGFGVLRGLHYQKNPHAQGKIVRCTKGKIFDVAVDIRKNSKTFGKWVGAILDEGNKQMLYIPKGFAHGFLALSETVEILYKASGEYAPACDRGIYFKDPTINIDWEKYGLNFEPTLSEKDKKQPKLNEINEEDLL